MAYNETKYSDIPLCIIIYKSYTRAGQIIATQPHQKQQVMAMSNLAQ